MLRNLDHTGTHGTFKASESKTLEIQGKIDRQIIMQSKSYKQPLNETLNLDLN